MDQRMLQAEKVKYVWSVMVCVECDDVCVECDGVCVWIVKVCMCVECDGVCGV